MSKYYVNYLLKKDQLEINIIQDLQNMYVPIFSHNFKHKINDFEKTQNLIDLVKGYFAKNIKLKKQDSVKHSLIISDKLYDSFNFYNIDEEIALVNNKVDEKTYRQYLQLLNKKHKNENYYAFDTESYLFVVENNLETKQYTTFPKDKVGQKLIVRQSIFSVRKNAHLVKFIEFFEQNNIKLNQVKLESQCLASKIEDETNKYQLLVNFNWRQVVVNGFFNNKSFYYEKIDCDIKKLLNVFKNDLKLNNNQISLNCAAVMRSWQFYSKTRMNLAFTEEKVFKYLDEAATEVVNKIKTIIEEKIKIPMEVILRGKNTDFLVAKFKELYPSIVVSTYDDKESQLSNLKDFSLGAIQLLENDNLSRKNLIDTLNDLPEYKPRNVFKRILDKFSVAFKLDKFNRNNTLI